MTLATVLEAGEATEMKPDVATIQCAYRALFDNSRRRKSSIKIKAA